MIAINETRTPLCNLADTSSRFEAKIQLLKFWLQQIDLAYEGYLRGYSYANAPISEELCNEDALQQRLYRDLFGGAMGAIEEIWKETTNLEGQ